MLMFLLYYRLRAVGLFKGAFRDYSLPTAVRGSHRSSSSCSFQVIVFEQSSGSNRDKSLGRAGGDGFKLLQVPNKKWWVPSRLLQRVWWLRAGGRRTDQSNTVPLSASFSLWLYRDLFKRAGADTRVEDLCWTIAGLSEILIRAFRCVFEAAEVLSLQMVALYFNIWIFCMIK